MFQLAIAVFMFLPWVAHSITVTNDFTAGKYITSSGPEDQRRVSLPTGFEGKIVKAYQYSPRAYALQVEGSGDSKGQNVWVSQMTNVSGIRLFADEDSFAKNKFDFITPEKAQYLRTEKPMTGFRSDIQPVVKAPPKIPVVTIPESTPAKSPEVLATEVISSTNDALMGKVESCKAENMMSSTEKALWALNEANEKVQTTTEATLIPVQVDTNPHSSIATICGKIENSRFEVCKEKSSVEKFLEDDFQTKFKEANTTTKYTITNKGPNNVISSPQEGKNRDWSFLLEGRARQDLGFSITDYSGRNVSDSQSSHIMLFPRKYLPHVREEGDRQIVTLPTGETVVFDAKTKSILSGALREEGPLSAGSKNSTAPKVKYSGSGVMVRIDGKTLEPRLQKNAKATITKNGRSCKVPASDLWPDQSDKSSVHFKYPTDEAFSSYLQKKCGFGL